MWNYRKIFILLSLPLIIAGCENIGGPVEPGTPAVLKTQTKWLVANNSDTKIHMVSFKEFDIDGNLLKNITYNEGNVKSVSDFEYHQGTSKENKTVYNEAGDVVSRTSHDYEIRNGRVEKEVSYDSTGDVIDIVEYSYDVNGNLVRRISIDPNSSHEIKIDFDYNYNSSGELISRITIRDGITSSRDSLLYISDYTLDIIKFDGNGNRTNKITFRYNPQGRITSETERNPNGEIIKRFHYDYTYFE